MQTRIQPFPHFSIAALKTLPAPLALLALFALPFLMGSAQADPAAMLAQLDTDGDGLVLEFEFVDGLKKLAFANLDQNGDNKVSKQEWIASEGGESSMMVFKRLDLTKDDNLEEVEFIHDVNSRAALSELFRALDRNGANALIPSHFKK